MASVAAFDAFEDRLTSAWSATPIAFENDDMQELVEASEPAPFVYVEIVGDTYGQESFGSPQANQFLERGVTFAHVLVPSGTGSRVARGYANDILNLFREQPTAGVFVEEMSIGEGQPGRDFPGLWALTVSMHWYRRDITNIP
jgi:hypothetical protein